MVTYRPERAPVPLVPAGQTADANLPIVGWACGTCGNVWPSRGSAVYCHGRPVCACGRTIAQKGYVACPRCRIEHEHQRRERFIARAEWIDPDDYDGPVWSFETDQYYSSIEEAVESLADDCDAPFELVLWPCDQDEVKLPDAGVLLEDIAEAASVDVEIDWPDSAYVELQRVINDWNAKYAAENVVWYYRTDQVILLSIDPRRYR